MNGLLVSLFIIIGSRICKLLLGFSQPLPKAIGAHENRSQGAFLLANDLHHMDKRVQLFENNLHLLYVIYAARTHSEVSVSIFAHHFKYFNCLWSGLFEPSLNNYSVHFWIALVQLLSLQKLSIEPVQSFFLIIFA